MTEIVTGPLAGLRVIDLTRVLAGPLCTMMLGDMGADVIKIEPPGTGDDTRNWGPPFVEGEAAYFLGVNRNKRSLTLNMAGKAGQEILAKLVRQADVLIDNFKLGTLSKWGFDDAWFEREAPRLVRCSITGYGPDGPKSALPGYDFILQAESGLMSICGAPDGVPTKYGVAIVDVCTGMLACNAILAAINARHHTGRGQKIDLSLYETSLFMLVNVASNYLVAGRNGGRFGNGHPSIVPYTTYPANDATIALGVGNEAQFAQILRACSGIPEWAKDRAFCDEQGPRRQPRRSRRPDCSGVRRRHADVWLDKLKAAGIPSGRINSVAQALDDPHTAARQMVETAEHPVVGALKMLGIPFKFSDTPGSVRRAPPVLGQHTDEILRMSSAWTRRRSPRCGPTR